MHAVLFRGTNMNRSRYGYRTYKYRNRWTMLEWKRRYSTRLCVISFFLFSLAKAQAAPTPVTYHSFQGDTLQLYAWEGQHVVFMTPTPNLDDQVMGEILDTVDKAYEFYTQVTGREPTKWDANSTTYQGHGTYQGKATIAAVPRTCGAGCGQIGWQGIELLQPYFDGFYTHVKDQGLYDQIVFYELGRNFFFFSGAVDAPDIGSPATTGFAIFMRFLSLEAAGVKGGPFNGKSWDYFQHSVEELVDIYKANPELNLKNTVLANKMPPNPMNLGVTDLCASFYFRLHRLFGIEFTKKFLQTLATYPKAQNTQDAIDNIILAACTASGRNLSASFIRDWRWPMSKEAQEAVAEMFNPNPENGDGLTGEYFIDKNLGQLKVTRVDPTVNFDWSQTPPYPNGSLSFYSVRWSGKVKPKHSGTYTFYTFTDDGVRLWVNGRLIIDKWQDQVAENTGTIDLVGGQSVDVKLEYYQNSGGAIVKLMWSGPLLRKQIIPQQRLFSQMK